MFVDDLPRVGRLAGVDFGTVRVGLATCDPSQTWVSPCSTYERKNESLDAVHFAEFVRQEGIVGWVVGLPIHCDGQESQKSKEARVFAEWLGECTERPFVFFDERFTTAQARQMMRVSGLSPQRKKKAIDRIAAHLILSNFLESRDTMTKADTPLEDPPPLTGC